MAITSIIGQQISNSLPSGMHLPDPFERLFQWMDLRRQFIDSNAVRFGTCVPFGEGIKPTAPSIEFTAQGSNDLQYWFGKDWPELHERLYVFAGTGGDGSMAAFWLDDAGKQQIVHLGSGSGSTMVCVLTDNAVDFLRLIAIGYDEICWGGFSEPPSGAPPVNTEFQDWIKSEFSTALPATGDAIVKSTSEMGDTDTQDPFLHWVNGLIAH